MRVLEEAHSVGLDLALLRLRVAMMSFRGTVRVRIPVCDGSPMDYPTTWPVLDNVKRSMATR